MKLLSSYVRMLSKQESGNVLVLVAFLLVVFLGMGVLVVDVGTLYGARRQMVTAADAAALAGAQQLIEDHFEANQFKINNVNSVVNNYALNLNGAGSVVEIDVTPENNPHTVRVVVDKEVNLWFYPAFAVLLSDVNNDEGTVTISASATAVAGEILGVGTLPIHMQESMYERFIDEDKVDFVQFHQEREEPGNWGWIKFENENAATTVSYLENGPPFTLYIGSTIWSNTGANIPAGNRQADVERILEEYCITPKEILYIPITEDIDNFTGKEVLKVIGFVAIVLDDFNVEQASSQTISGKILSDILTEGPINAGIPDDEFALKGVTLTE